MNYNHTKGSIAQCLAYLLLDPAAPVPYQHSKILFREKIVNMAQFDQWRSVEESGQWLEIVDKTRLVLASGKPVPQKTY